jgi:hypothetical protein
VSGGESADDALPAAVLRRFWGHDASKLLRAEHRDFLIGRLLEEADGAELRWLLARVGRAAVASFVARRGGRQLSRRSRAFWTAALGVDAPPATALQHELWPLA